MVPEPIVVPAHPPEPAVQVTTENVTQPTPTVQQQRLADDVFTEKEGQVVATLMAAQAGMGILHHLALETFAKPAEKPRPPRDLPLPNEDDKDER
jgi:hypothetical protein